MDLVLSEEMEDRVRQQEEAEQRIVALSEKIVDVIIAERVTIGMAEHALRRATTIVRTHTVVTFTLQ